MSLRHGKGRVVARYGAEFEIRTDDGETIIATGRKKHRDVVCGDFVAWKEETPGNYALTDKLPRKNALSRSSFRGQSKTLAANIDQIVIVTAPQPQPDWEIVDQLLIVSEQLDTNALILHHKSDLHADSNMLGEWTNFRNIGYPVLETCVEDKNAMQSLKKLLSDKTSILVGQSGVGKSSLARELLGDSAIRIGEVSEATRLGQHTTSVTRLYGLPEGGYLIDSPGVRDFSPDNLDQKAIKTGFREISKRSGQCRFQDCNHINEPDCAVKTAVQNGDISQRRYESYINLLQTAG